MPYLNSLNLLVMFDYSLQIAILFLLFPLVSEGLPVYQIVMGIFLFPCMILPLYQAHDCKSNENNPNADELHLPVLWSGITCTYMHGVTYRKDRNNILELVSLYSKSYEHSLFAFILLL